jgi:RNA polymerase sigma-70 factor (ECF subfamily)
MLVAAALAGDDDAFALLMQRYQAALFRLALSRLAKRELAEEVVQETFLAAHRWLATYDSRYSFRTWLWSVLLSQCVRQAKREARQTSETLGQEPAIEHASPLSAVLARESHERVHELLARLPAPQADALRLRFFAGLTFPEIAAAMQCSEAGAKHRVKTGLMKLGEWLKWGEQPAYRLADRGDET